MLLATCAAGAGASPVLVFDGERARAENDPYLPAADLPAPPRRAAARSRASAAQRGPTVYQELDRLLAEGQIDQIQHDVREDSYKRARRAYRALSGTPKLELRAAMRNVETVAATGQLTPSRLEPLFLTLDRNREWWSASPSIANGQRITFTGSELVFQYYRGQGIQIQPLANFGKANSYWARKRESRLRNLLDELIPLASDRGGTLAWEYYFAFGGGVPPWTSGMSQGTAVQALGRAADLLGEPAYRDLALRALGSFELAPPVGVRMPTPAGAHYLLYTFDTDLLVLNGFLQAVIGLHDFAELTGDPRARALFEAGDAEARGSVPSYDTGAWSLYSLERESDLGYHTLVRDFLTNLCERTTTTVYCDTSARFSEYMDTPPLISPQTRRIRAGKPRKIRFELSKISRVGMTIVSSSGRTVFATSATAGFGERFFTWSRPSAPGAYTLRLSATDLAGNRSSAEGPLRILRPKRRR